MDTDEQLETGYGTATPLDDSFCNDYQLSLADAYTALADKRGDRVLHDAGVTLCDAASPSRFLNVAIVREPSSDAGWRVLADRVRGFFTKGSGGSFLLYSAWPTPDLATYNFACVGHPLLMIRWPAPVTVDPILCFEIRAVTDKVGAEAWESVFIESFPVRELQPFRPGSILPPPTLAAPGWQHWVGYLDGVAVATASAYVGKHHLNVENISTLERARGRGIGRCMTATATAARPDLPAMLIASDLGRPVYSRLGYQSLLHYTLWAGDREGSAVMLEESG